MSRPFCRPVFQTPPDFHGRTLVLPVISVGSVPQLAVDLLIHAPELQCARVATLDGAECVPFVAPSEDGSATAAVYTALDVYQAPGSGLVIVQQRSPVLKSHKTHFAQRLKAWIEEAGFAEVLIIASMDAAFRTDAEMHTAQWKLCPPKATDTPLAAAAAHLPTFGDTPLPPIPGGGMTRTYLEHAPPTTLALLQFSAEGDNRGDAYALAAEAARLCRVPVETWHEPDSWRTLFGPAPDQQLYG